MSRPLSRRTVLRGASGIAIGLPLLEAMMPRKAHAAEPTYRWVTMYFPDGTYQGTALNGRKMGAWWPAATGPLPTTGLPPALQGLESNVGDFCVIGGIANKPGYSGKGSAGGHNRAPAYFMTCAEQQTAGTVDQADSVDQILATAFSANTTFKRSSLVLAACKAGTAADSGDVRYLNNLSYKNRTIVSQERSPANVFNSLFMGIGPTQTPPPRDPAARQSILDFVKSDTASLKTRLGVADQKRVDEYLTSVREIERRVQDLEKPGATTMCSAPAAPAGSLNGSYGGNLPAEYTLQVKAMVDLIVNAFVCDLTRVATLMLAAESHYLFYNTIAGDYRYMSADLNDDRHIGAAHHEDNPAKINRLMSIHRYELSFFKYLLDGLKAKKDLTGATLLDSTVVVYGTGLADGNGHNFEDIALLVGGKGGGIQPGRFLKAPNNTPIANVYLGLLQRMGLGLTSFGADGGKSTGVFNLG
ncbi:MAG: DUF1552 domain-containing protein [Archangiaceae bacterium]|nr:DUF1552 domain-containing protein [Archangiaceae bacterium]